MTEKAVIIDACCLCRHRYRFPGDTRLRCFLTERDIDLIVNDLEIPNWCPLPDVEDEWPDDIVNDILDKLPSIPLMKWISVEDSLPVDYEIVLVNGGTAIRVDGKWYSGIDEPRYAREITWEVTHWMPLPEPPVARATKEKQNE